MSIITPEVYSYKSTQNVQPYGEALVSFGLEVRGAIDGYGPLSRGLLWEMQAIWTDVTTYANISTTWINAIGTSVGVTSWVASAGSSVGVTSWTPALGGMNGDYLS